MGQPEDPVESILFGNDNESTLVKSEASSAQFALNDAQSCELSVAASQNTSESSNSFLRHSRTVGAMTIASFRNSAQRPRRSSLRTSADSSSVMSDLNRLKFDWLGLYGREDELKALHHAYARLGTNAADATYTNDKNIPTGTKEEQANIKESQQYMNLFLLGGLSGTGKSAIIKEYSKESCEKDRHTIFISGKFDQYLATPYAPFRSAFTQLCSKLQTHELFGDQLKLDILQVFGGDHRQAYHPLLDLIPNIGELVYEAAAERSSKQGAIPDGRTDIPPSRHLVGFNEQQYESEVFDIVKSEKKFKFLLQRFLATVCKPQHKVVLILDDVQWISGDAASLNLLEMLLTDPVLHNTLLVVCSYRDNEMDDEHPFSQRLKSIERKRNQQADKLTVGNLSLPSVHAFITDLFNTEPAETEELAKIAHKKVQGNVFFLIQFITALRDAGFVKFHVGKMKWTWDETAIRKSTVVADNVLAILMLKMDKLPRRLKRMLQIAACLGASFDEVVITIIARKLKNSNLLLDIGCQDGEVDVEFSTADILQDIVNEGLLECIPHRSGSRSYCFAHDQIELAANALLDEDQLPELKLKIGRILYENRASFDYQSLMFHVVDMWNDGAELVSEAEQVQILIRLNHQAGKKAMESSAFEASTVYLRKAISLIPKEKRWEEHYPLSLELYNCLIKAEYSNGSWGKLRQNIDEVLAQKGRPVWDKQVAYFTMITILVVRDHNHQAAINYAVDVLAQYGAPFHPQLGLLAVIGALIKTQKLVKKIPLDSLLEKEYMVDPTKYVAIDVFSAVNSSLYAANPALLLCIVLKALRWSLKYGLSKETPKSIGFYALLQMAMGNPKLALSSAKLALSLAEKQNLINTEFSPISSVYGFVFPWTAPLHVCRNNLLSGYNSGLQNGDLHHAFINVTLYCFFCFTEGKPLVDVEANMREFGRQMKECNQSLQLQFLSLTWQTTLNLMGRCDDPVVLSGEVMSQEEMLKAADDDMNPPLRAQVHCHRLQLAVYYRDFELAGKLLGPVSVIGAVNPGNPIVWRTALFEGVAAFELTRRKQKKWKSTALRALAKVTKWVDEGNVNCVHILLLLQAEKAAMDKKYDDARTLFNKAIATAARHGYRNDRALASERCADMHVHIGDADWASDYSQKAYKAYEEMEAFGKLDHMTKDHATLGLALDLGEVWTQVRQEVSSLNATDAATHQTPFTESTLTLQIYNK
jgi:predicted ATPase